MPKTSLTSQNNGSTPPTRAFYSLVFFFALILKITVCYMAQFEAICITFVTHNVNFTVDTVYANVISEQLTHT